MNKESYHIRFANFYNSKEWHDLRNYKWEQADGLCELCRKKGIIREGKEVHHIEPIEKNWNKRFDYDNLILLCPDCHNAQHERISPLQKFLREW